MSEQRPPELIPAPINLVGNWTTLSRQQVEQIEESVNANTLLQESGLRLVTDSEVLVFEPSQFRFAQQVAKDMCLDSHDFAKGNSDWSPITSISAYELSNSSGQLSHVIVATSVLSQFNGQLRHVRREHVRAQNIRFENYGFPIRLPEPPKHESGVEGNFRVTS